MTFEKFQFTKRNWLGGNGITVNKNYVTIGRNAYKAMGSPELLDIYYDIEKSVIKFVPNEKGRKVFITRKGYILINARLARVMPVGAYNALTNNKFLFYFQKP